MKASTKRNYRNRPRVQLICNDPSLAKQSFKDESNINNIVKKHHATGIPFPTSETVGATFGDFSAMPDYHTAMSKVTHARERFEELPSAIRKQFQNDPGQFIDFVNDPANAEELVTMGLAHPAEPTLVDELATAIKSTQKEPQTSTTTAPDPT